MEEKIVKIVNEMAEYLNICKSQYKNVQKTENKNVHFPV